MSYEALMRDARDELLTASTRVRSAFDATYTCLAQLVSAIDIPADNDEQFARTVVARALSTLSLSSDDAAFVNTLREWVLTTAPLEPLPMSPEEAIALAERVHKAGSSG